MLVIVFYLGTSAEKLEKIQERSLRFIHNKCKKYAKIINIDYDPLLLNS